MTAVRSFTRGFPLDFYGAIGDGTSDDTSEIQAALTAADIAGGGLVYGTCGKTYKISSPLTIYSDTSLDMTGCTVTLAEGSNSNMLRTPGATGSTRIENVRVIGGRWNRGSNSSTTGNSLNGLVFRKVDGLRIRDVEYTSTGGKYGMLVVDCTDFVVDGFHADSCFSDGVHVQGPASHGTIRNVYGYAGDDLVAVVPLDYPAYVWGDEGDVTDLLIENVRGEATERCIVKVVGGAGLDTLRVTVRDIKGTSVRQGVWVGDDATEENTTGGRLDQILLDNINVRTGVGYAQIQLNPSNAGCINVSNVSYSVAGQTSQDCVYVGPEAAASVEDLIVAGVTVVDGAGAVVNVYKGAVDRCVVSGVVGTPAASQAIVRLTDAQTAEIGSLTVSDVNVTPVTSTGSVVRAISSTHTIPSVSLSNIHAGYAWIADLGTTSTLRMANVYNTGGQFNVRSGAALTIVADQSCLSNAGAVTITSATVGSKGLGLKADVSTLSNTAGDMAWNTNAGLGCGTGPVIANGSVWKHLYTGSTT